MNYKTIVLLDDNTTTNFYNTDVLSDFVQSAHVVSFENSDTFLNEYNNLLNQSTGKNLLLLDINMPNKSGYEVLEELEEQDDNSILSNLDVIMLSSSNLKSDYEKATHFANIIGYIEKPLTVDKLKNTILGIV